MKNSNINHYGISKYSKDNYFKDIILRKGWFISNLNLNIEQEIFEECEKLNSVFDSNSESIRSPLLSSRSFLKLALHNTFMNINNQIDPSFYLNQQNLLRIKSNNIHDDQSRWHRDIPHQNWIPRGLAAFNVLFSISKDNYPIHVLDIIEGSHNYLEFPNEDSLQNLNKKIFLNQGEFLFMNSFLFHRAPIQNSSNFYLINHVITSRFFKQQISLKKFLKKEFLSLEIVKKNETFLGINEKDYIPTLF